VVTTIPRGPAPRSRTALVTGASRGIGAAVARRLAAEGYDLTLSGRRPEPLEALAAELAGAGTKVHVVLADMAVEEQVRSLGRSHLDRSAALDLLVLCAGVGAGGAVPDYPMRRFDLQVAVNVRAPFVLVQECLPGLRQAAADRPERGARVVAVASLTGVASEPGLAAYAATKAALISLCQSISTEESQQGVSATAISPGYVDTEMSAWVRDRVDRNEMIEPADIAELVTAVTRLSARAVIPNVVVTRRGSALWRA
jgi:3-oxoacyl-[acyl-carrier protein] reductase